MRAYRNRELLDLAYELPCMLNFSCCTGGVGEPAHSNQSLHGKGMSIKAHDCFFVPACRACHSELDHGKTMTREERVDAWNRAFFQMTLELWRQGLIAASPHKRGIR